MRPREECDDDFGAPSDRSKVVANERRIGFVIPSATDPRMRPRLGRRGTVLFTKTAH